MPRYGHPLLARDQADMPPRGSTSPTSFDQGYNPQLPNDQDPGNVQCSAQECLLFVQTLINGFDDPDEKAQFIEGLSNIISSDGDLEITHHTNGNGNGNGGRSNVPPYGDRSRRTSRDQGLPNNNMGSLDRSPRSGQRGARDQRRPGMDSNIQALNTAGFLRRFPMAANIRFSGTGRY